MKEAALAPLFFVCVLLVAGCATDGRSTPVPAATPRHNLAGYSSGFKEGYADACASPQRQSAERFKSDNDYRMGWTDGTSLCRK